MLKVLRKNKGLIQKELANRVGISQSYLSKIESPSVYKIKISVDLVESLAMELNICPFFLFGYFSSIQRKCDLECIYTVKMLFEM